MYNKKWTAYKSHADALCFWCGNGGLILPHKSGMPAGQGEWQAHCGSCKHMTWYDIPGAITVAAELQAIIDNDGRAQ